MDTERLAVRLAAEYDLPLRDALVVAGDLKFAASAEEILVSGERTKAAIADMDIAMAELRGFVAGMRGR
ncbi:MAG: hypothetical protein PHS14_15135 [Elusimicrobia bacterium]|nr:hypothetical protein [Elusimicrobiota bacterium]